MSIDAQIQELRTISNELQQHIDARQKLMDRPLIKDLKLVGAALAALPWHALAPYAQHK